MHQVMQKLQLVQSPFQIATIAEMATVITAESEAKKKIGDQDLNRLGSARITLGRLRKEEGSRQGKKEAGN